MWKSDYQTLVPFVRPTDKTQCSVSNEFISKRDKYARKHPGLETDGKDIREFYENLVNSDESISPWSDSIKIKSTNNIPTSIITSPKSCNDDDNNNGDSCSMRSFSVKKSISQQKHISFPQSDNFDNNTNSGTVGGQSKNYICSNKSTDPLKNIPLSPASTDTLFSSLLPKSETKIDLLEKSTTNYKPVFSQGSSISINSNTDEMIQQFSVDHIRNSVLRCAQEGNLPALKQHLESGSVNLINCTDSFGWTPLMCASFGGHTDVVQFLLTRDGVNARYRNSRGQSALGLSIKARHRGIRKLIETHQNLSGRRSEPSSSLNRKAEEEEPLSRVKSTGVGKALAGPTKKNNSQRREKNPEYFCEVCQMQVKNTTKIEHDSSTVHLLSRHPEPLPESYFLTEQNRGFQLMVKGGWDTKEGLGPTGKGRRIPIKTILKRDTKGLGVKRSCADVARVSHFGAKDTNAILHNRKDAPVSQTLNKKKMASIRRREKRKEQFLRRSLDFN